MLPTQRYNELMSRQRFKRDLTQEHALLLMDRIFTQIVDSKNNKDSFLSFLWKKKEIEIKGFYFWGGVGRGKTFLMDLFYEVLPVTDKKRMHFHHFMQDVHHQLSLIKDQKNPLKLIAKTFSTEFSILCLDEFMVHDIGDAMILSELLSALHLQGITLMTTSNTAPENLYQDGLQRSQFMSTIEHINDQCHILHIDGGIDYRNQNLDKNLNPLFQEDCAKILPIIESYDLEEIADESSIEVRGRKIEVIKLYKSAVWFDFSAICKTTRSRVDYIDISQQFLTVIISNIQSMDDQSNDVTRRFITLIDVLYDQKIRLIFNIQADMSELYTGKFLKFEFSRTISRLNEMQSSHYLNKRQ